MPGSPHPIESVYVDGDDVPKSGVRSYAETRTPLVVSDSDEIRSLDLSTQTVVILADNGRIYRKDASDTTSPDDDNQVIVDANGLRWKLPDYQTQVPVVSVTAAKTLDLSDAHTNQVCTGNSFFALTLPASTTYTPGTKIVITNADVYSGPGTGRARLIKVQSVSTRLLYPGMSVTVTALSGGWQFDGSKRWDARNGEIVFYSDFTNGSDTFGAVDGLAAGASAFKTAQIAAMTAYNAVDFNGREQTLVVIQLAANTIDQQGLHIPFHDMVGAQGHAAFLFKGATLPILGAANNGSGLIRLTLASTASYVTNQNVSVYGVLGTTEANRAWKVTVINSTKLDLQGSVFANAYVSGGTITDGSVIRTTGADAVAVYYAVVKFGDLVLGTITEGDALSVNWGAIVVLADGMVFSACAGTQIRVMTAAVVQATREYGIDGNSTVHVRGEDGGQFSANGKINFLSNAVFNTFAIVKRGNATFFDTINTNSKSVTGIRWNAQANGVLDGVTGAPNTDFPGNVNGSASTGGQTL